MVRVEGRRAAVIRPKFSLSDAIKQYVHENGSNVIRFARMVGLSEGPVYNIVRHGDEGCAGRQICVLECILSVLGYTLDDYDPQIRQGLAAPQEINRLLDTYPAYEIARRMGFAHASGLERTLTKFRTQKSEQLTYQSVCRLAMVFEEDFMTGMQPDRRTKTEHVERPVFGPTSLAKAAKLHSNAGETLLRGVAGTLLMPSMLDGARYDAEADKLTFDSATGMYRFEVTKDTLIAIWKETGEVSMRREIA